MSGSFHVDYTTLHAAARDVHASRDRVSDRLKRLWGAVAEVERAWEGQASDAYQALMRQWNGDSRQLLTAMGRIADLLDHTANAHEATEDRTQQSFGRHRAGE